MADYEFPDDSDAGKVWAPSWEKGSPRNAEVPLAKDPGPVPDPLEQFLGTEIGDHPPFHQYLLAVGATGDKPADLPKRFHDVGMQFAHAAGLEPLLAVGYVSEAAHPADYLSAAKVWHNHMTDLDHQDLKAGLPKFYTALSVLFGVRS